MVILLCIYSCKSNHEKYPQKKWIKTEDIGDGIYVERWLSNQYGVFANNTDSYFLTDSSSFVSFLDICDDEEFYVFTWMSDSLIEATKLNRITKKTIYKRYIHISHNNVPKFLNENNTSTRK